MNLLSSEIKLGLRRDLQQAWKNYMNEQKIGIVLNSLFNKSESRYDLKSHVNVDVNGKAPS